MAAGVSPGSMCHAGSLLRMLASVSEISSPSKGRRPRAFRRARRRTPRCQPARRQFFRAPALAPCTRPSQEHTCLGGVDRERRGHRGAGHAWPVKGLCQAEVEHLDAAIPGQRHIRGFQIPVDDAFLVRGFECFGDLSGDGERFINRQRPLADAIREGLAIDQFEDEEVSPVRLVDAVDRADVRMVQRGEDLRFAAEARETIGIVDETVRKDLQRDVATEFGVARAIHVPHAAGSERRNDFMRPEAGAGGQGHEAPRFY